MNWYLTVLRRYAEFSGRSRRKEYWYFVLFNSIFIVTLSVVDVKIGTYNPQADLGLLSGLYVAATLLPSIAVSVRRLHDIDCSGWWLLVSFVPFLGIALLFFMVDAGTAGENGYGPDPREESGSSA